MKQCAARLRAAFRDVLRSIRLAPFALAAVLAPWLYAPADRRARLAWFSGATLVAGALAVRAYLTGT